MNDVVNLKLPCELYGQRIIPVVRAYIAKELIEKYGLTQIEVAKKLGITQAAISQYLHSKRGLKYLEMFKNASNQIEPNIHDIAEGIYLGKISPDELKIKLCELCQLIRRNMYEAKDPPLNR